MTDTTPAPPVAKTVPHTLTAHGETRTDPYFWLRDREDPDTLAYLEAENRHTEAVMASTQALQDTLYREMLGRLKETDLSVPSRLDSFYYYVRTEQGQQYAIYCRRAGSPSGPDPSAAEEVLLDGNQLAEGQPYFALGNFSVSPNHRLLAYATDTAGDETYTLQVKDLATGELLPDRIPNTYYGLEWGNDNRTLFYVTLDAAKRPFRLHRHTLGTPAEQDTLVHEETDERFYLRVGKTRSRRFVLLQLGSFVTTEMHLLEAGHPEGQFRVVLPRRHEVEYDVDHHGDSLFLRINDTGRNFRLVQAPLAAPAPESWHEVIPHRPSVMIEEIDAFARHLVVSEREDGLRRLQVIRLADGASHHVGFPEEVYTAGLAGNAEFDTDTLRFSYTSMVTPSSVFDYGMETRERTLLKQQEIPSGYDGSLYETHRLHATAPDGARIPVSVVHRRGVQLDGANPAYLYGYGSYGVTIEPSFSASRLSLLDRGFVYAIAHIRGGAELGKPWHDDGKLLRKRNTFTDFIASAERLIELGYTRPDRLVAAGGSAGGLLMGATINLRPDLFHAIVAHVPFVDVLNTAQDPTLPLTVGEYEEWGNSSESKEVFDYIRSYSPYDNVEAKPYPHLLATAGLNDPRVSYWEPAKWVAKLRATRTGDRLLLLKTTMEAGHSGPSGRYERLKETAFEYAFLLKALGMA